VSVPLLLHSLTEHREVIFGCLDAIGARSAVEVGSEHGGFTSELAAWAAERGGWAASVEPFPADGIRRLAATAPHFRLVEARSPQALREVEPADAYVLDGDHVYAVVLEELRTVAELAGPDRPHPLVLLHDVGWPWGRRDLYYDPASLPPEQVHPHTWDHGVVPGERGVVDGGFRGEGAFAVALEEGGERNGVLTAVEDYLGQSDADLAYAHVPSVFGLGVVYPRGGEAGERLAALLAHYDRSPLLARLEENRLALFLRVVALQDELRAHDLRLAALRDERRSETRLRSRVLTKYAERLAAVEAENARLRLQRVVAASAG
jgi:hypothetical protein